MFKPGEIKKHMVLFGLLIGTSTPVIAIDDLIIPQICVKRAEEIGIFHDKKTTNIGEKLQITQAAWQVYDFGAMSRAYEQTMTSVSLQLEDYKSSLFQHLLECRNNERTCHGWFQSDNAFHLQIFCDSQILSSTLNSVQTIKESRFDKCVHQPYDIITEEDLQNDRDLIYEKSCFEKKTENSITYLKNKSKKYLQEIQYLEAWNKKVVEFSVGTIEKTLIPEGIDYIYRKVIEEFEDIDIRPLKVSDLNLFYLKADLIRDFSSCCENNTPLSNEGSKSFQGLYETSGKLAHEMTGHSALIFETHDVLSELIFDEAEQQYWRDKLKILSPLNLTVTEKNEYFKFLSQHENFYLDQKTSFSNVVQEVKKNDRSKYEYRMMTEAEWTDHEHQQQKFKEQRGYIEYAPLEPYKVDLDDETQVINHFLFNRDFKKNYLADLEKEEKKAEYERFENQKKRFYPRIFKGFLPYQFARTAQSKIVRELQKTTLDQAKIKLASFQSFREWADIITCTGHETTYCNPSENTFREKKLRELYEKIISEVVPMNYLASSATQSKRKYIYDYTFLRTLNNKIKTINNYCWETTDSENYKKNKKSFSEKAESLDHLMQSFYSTPRFEELLGQTDFAAIAKFNPTDYADQCFIKGYVFGNDLEPSMAGRKVVKTTYMGINSPGIPMYTEIEAKDDGLKFQLAYLPSNFGIKKYEIEKLEDSIEELLVKEFKILEAALNYSDSQQEKFLEESALKRLFAMVDYSIDFPSSQVAAYLCELIKNSDRSSYDHMKNIQLVQGLIIGAATVVTIYSLGTFTAAGMAIISGSKVGFGVAASSVFVNNTLLVISAAGIGVSLYEIKYYGYQNDLLDMSLLTQNTNSLDALLLHQYYGEKISEQQISMAYNFAFLAIAGFKPVVKGVRNVRRLFDKQHQETFVKRKGDVDSILERTPEETIHNAKKTALGIERVAEEERFILNDQIKNFIYDYQKVTDEQFNLFVQAFAKGEGEAFIHLHWGKELGRHLPVRRIEPLPVKDLPLSTTPRLMRPIDEVVSPVHNLIFVNRYTFKLKIFFENVFRFNFKLNKNEDWMVSILQRAQRIKIEKGITIFTDDEIKAIAANMKKFKLGDDGKFYRTFDHEMEQTLSKLLIHSVAGDAYQIRKYLEPLVHSNLLNEKEWLMLMEHMTAKIRSLDDCKDLLKFIKFGKREYTLAEQWSNMPELLSGKDFFKALIEDVQKMFPAFSKNIRSADLVYNKRFNLIVKDVDQFLALARYARYRNNIGLVDDLKDAILRSGKKIEQIEAEIQKFDKDFSFSKKMKEYDAQKAYINKFNVDVVVNSNSFFKQGLGELAKNEQALLSSYKQQFLKLEEHFNRVFHKKLIRFLTKGTDVVQAYKGALYRAQHVKQTSYECSLPSTKVRIEANRAYKNTAGTISLITTANGYWSVHKEEDKDLEWISRFGYELLAGQLGARVQAAAFTSNKGGGPFYKITRDMISGLYISSGESALYGGVSTVFWDKRSKLENDFKNLIYESPDPKKTIEQFFIDHPEIKGQILAQFGKINQVFNEVQLRNSKGDMVDSDMEDAFVRAGLIDNILYSDMQLKDRELGEDYLYHELIQNGYLDEDLYRDSQTNEELEDQIIELLADIQYQNLYDYKTGELNMPFLDPMTIGDGDLDWMEINTGSEALDRSLFYPMFDLAKTSVSYPKNYAVYWLLCNARHWPGNSNLYAALGLHLVYKAYMDPFKYYMREQATGR
jgi:hypothetical protein